LIVLFPTIGDSSLGDQTPLFVPGTTRRAVFLDECAPYEHRTPASACSNQSSTWSSGFYIVAGYVRIRRLHIGLTWDVLLSYCAKIEYFRCVFLFLYLLPLVAFAFAPFERIEILQWLRVLLYHHYSLHDIVPYGRFPLPRLSPSPSAPLDPPRRVLFSFLPYLMDRTLLFWII